MTDFSFQTQFPITEYPIIADIAISKEIIVDDENIGNIKPIICLYNEPNFETVFESDIEYKSPGWTDYYELYTDGTLIYKGALNIYDGKLVVYSYNLSDAKYVYSSGGHNYVLWSNTTRVNIEGGLNKYFVFYNETQGLNVYLSSFSSDTGLKSAVVHSSYTEKNTPFNTVTIKRNVPDAYFYTNTFDSFPSINWNFIKLEDNKYRCDIWGGIVIKVPTTTRESLVFPYYSKTHTVSSKTTIITGWIGSDYGPHTVYYSTMSPIFTDITAYYQYDETRTKIRYKTIPCDLKYKVIFTGLKNTQYGSTDSYELRTK